MHKQMKEGLNKLLEVVGVDLLIMEEELEAFL